MTIEIDKVTETTSFLTCPLCEATCGLAVTTRGAEIITIKGDEEDVFSKGHICPKAYSLKELHTDPNRLRHPQIRVGDTFKTASWQAAWEAIEEGFTRIYDKYGRDAVALYLGNPNAHTLSGTLYMPNLLAAARTKNFFSASTVDQMPKQVSSAMMFGGGATIAIPDLDYTDYLLILGANPLVSNGSLMTAPDTRGKLRAIRRRGGKIVVIDPVRTRTAEEADEHHFIRPGTDAFLLFGIVNTLFAENLVKLGAIAEHIAGVEDVRHLAQPFTPEVVADTCGIPAEMITRLAREFAQAPSAVAYGRIGTCTQEFGTLTSALVDIINALTGNLDRQGGAMFTKPAAGSSNTRGKPGKGRGFIFGRHKSRVRGLPEFFSELPVSCMAEEMDTPGEGQVHALITVAGNPVLSTPNGERLQNALRHLEFMVSVDIYRNETASFANVILPVPGALERSHYDVAFTGLAVHNYANYSPALYQKPADMPHEWETILKLAAILSGKGASADPGELDDAYLAGLVQRETRTAGSRIEGADSSEIIGQLSGRRGPERQLDFLLRSGPYGDAFGRKAEGLTFDQLEATPHGIDLGALQPRIPEVLRTATGMVELAPEPIQQDVTRLHAALNRPQPELVLIGRRNLRSNNSWMHNLPVLVKGKPACTLQMNPQDAQKYGLESGQPAAIRSRVGEVVALVEITEKIAPGVVSLPHGWGHNLPGADLDVARANAGVNSNILSDETAYDPLSGNAVLNGIPVSVRRVDD